MILQLGFDSQVEDEVGVQKTTEQCSKSQLIRANIVTIIKREKGSVVA